MENQGLNKLLKPSKGENEKSQSRIESQGNLLIGALEISQHEL